VPPATVALLAASATDQIERWSPVVLFLIAAGILWLRHQDRKRGPDEEDWDDDVV